MKLNETMLSDKTTSMIKSSLKQKSILGFLTKCMKLKRNEKPKKDMDCLGTPPKKTVLYTIYCVQSEKHTNKC